MRDSETLVTRVTGSPTLPVELNRFYDSSTPSTLHSVAFPSPEPEPPENCAPLYHPLELRVLP